MGIVIANIQVITVGSLQTGQRCPVTGANEGWKSGIWLDHNIPEKSIFFLT